MRTRNNPAGANHSLPGWAQPGRVLSSPTVTTAWGHGPVPGAVEPPRVLIALVQSAARPPGYLNFTNFQAKIKKKWERYRGKAGGFGWSAPLAKSRRKPPNFGPCLGPAQKLKRFNFCPPEVGRYSCMREKKTLGLFATVEVGNAD